MLPGLLRTCDLYVASGDLAQALRYAEKGTELADTSRDWVERRDKLTALADVLHQAGQLEEAAALFREAEAMQEENQPQFPLLYSLRGHQYCDLLLDQGKYQEVRGRVRKLFEWREPGDPLLDIALEHLSLGRAHLLQAQSALSPIPSPASGRGARGEGDYTQATAHLNRAVDTLRQAGQQDYIPHGLLARAALYRAQGQFDRAQRDLDEALAIAQRGSMRLHEADCHLEYTRLHLAREDRDAARACLAKARTMVAETGYHRRDGEVAELEEALEEQGAAGEA
jgi:tetratricopeptide (TPR) repeat protein